MSAAPRERAPVRLNDAPMAVTPVETDAVIGRLIAICDTLLTVIEDEGLGSDDIVSEARDLITDLDPARWYRRAGLIHPDLVEYVGS